MPDRKYTYTVEVDAAGAVEAARQLRTLFQRELGDILATPAGARQAGPAAELRQMQQAATEARTAMQEIGKVDITAGIDELNQKLQDARRNANLARAEFERLRYVKQEEDPERRRNSALLADHIEAVRRQVGDDAARQVQLAGRAVNIGQRGAEHPSDQVDYAKLDSTIAEQDAVREKQRYTAEQKSALLAAELNAYEEELNVIRIERQIAEQRSEEINKQTAALLDAGTEINESNARIFEEADDAERAARELAASETDLIQSVERASKQLADHNAAQAEKIARNKAVNAGEIFTPAAGPAAAGMVYTQQTALTVSGKSVENAERLAAEMERVAGAAQRYTDALMSVNRREFDLDIEREKAKIQRDSLVKAQKEIEEIKKQGQQERAEAERTAEAKKKADREAAEAKKKADREAAEAQKKADREAAEASKREARDKANVEKQADREAKQAQRQALREQRNAERQAAKEYQQEQKEKARAAKQAAREAAEATKQQGQFTRDLFGKPFGMSWGSLLGGAAATAGIYGIDQLARGAYDSGRSGAQQMRQEDSFRQFAQAQGRDADALVRSIQRASKETITATDAMGLASQVLAQKFSAGRASITSDLETLVTFARRASQIYRDESGAFLSTEEIFARLIKYAREGNKELVDQFGLSNAAIAEALGTTVNGLASANGATDRWRGLIKVLNGEIDRLGEANLTLADKIEKSEQRVTAAKQRMDRALAPAAAWAAGTVADIVEGATFGVAKERQLGTAENAKAMQGQAGALAGLFFNQDGQKAAEEQIRRLNLMQMATKQVFEAQKTGSAGADEYAAKMAQIEAAVAATNTVTDDALSTIIEINNWFQEASASADQLGKAAAAAAEDISLITPMAEDARDSLIQLARQMAAGLTLNVGLNTADVTIRNQAELAGRRQYVPGTGWVASDPFSTTPIGESIRALGGNQTGLMENPSAEARRQPMYDAWDVRAERKREEERAAKEAERAWTSAAKSAASDFEQAANDAAGAFKDALEKIPGLFSTSQVTEQDMKDAALGIYKDKPDEYLRQLRDEVLNKKDYPGVSLADIAGVAGIDQGLSQEAQLAIVERMWNDSSLFANPEALRFLNKDAIQAEQDNAAKSEKGRQNILSWLGLGEDSPLTPDQQGAFSKLIGLDEAGAQQAGADARAAFDAGFYSPTAGPAAEEAGTAAPSLAANMVAQIESDIKAGPISDAIYGLGSGIIAKMHAGFRDAAANTDWGDPVFQALAADVAPIVFTMLKDELPPA